MRMTIIVAAAIGILLCAAAGWVIWRFAGLPEQPAHAAVARVIAITPDPSRFHQDRETIVIRNERGTGEFEMRIAEARCDVGDRVEVRQRGTTLTRGPSTCR